MLTRDPEGRPGILCTARPQSERRQSYGLSDVWAMRR